ncbi:hypothetical protein E4U43_000950 [Claviceps pusilla]|uniref:Rhodopsin domain-containing protein n=1 Tax=Claviceps pusilla TaxID=123648 RepID=A0A9P7SYN3_9HYPO|nr:hypothetical protein E4U43_000950 [Claviceps pusilla]
MTVRYWIEMEPQEFFDEREIPHLRYFLCHQDLVDWKLHVARKVHGIYGPPGFSLAVLSQAPSQPNDTFLPLQGRLFAYNRMKGGIMSEIALESWAWYGLTWISQIMLRGSLKKLKLDDYLMVIIMAVRVSYLKGNVAQCSAATNHLITNAVLNVSSDIMIILIPMPVFLQSQLALKKKFILIGVFALGSFTILSAILNKFHSFKNPFDSQWIFWYIRESSTAIIVANLPLTWTVFRRLFNLGSFNDSEYSYKMRSAKLGSRSLFHTTHPCTQARDYMKQGKADGDDLNGSEEHIAQSYGISLKIYQRHDVQISSEQAPQGKRGKWSIETLPDGFITTTVIEGGQPRSVFHAAITGDTADAAIAETSLADSSYPVANIASGV